MSISSFVRSLFRRADGGLVQGPVLTDDSVVFVITLDGRRIPFRPNKEGVVFEE